MPEAFSAQPQLVAYDEARHGGHRQGPEWPLITSVVRDGRLCLLTTISTPSSESVVVGEVNRKVRESSLIPGELIPDELWGFESNYDAPCRRWELFWSAAIFKE
jgi:hypothetical protein